MKRHRILLSDLATDDNLLLALWKAARGKRHRPDVIHFLDYLDHSLDHLRGAILQEQAPCGRYREFFIHDPKRRLIHAACFEDRVLHHAIMNLAEPVFERLLVPYTYACRPNKGVHRAVAQVQTNLGRYPWFVKLDIAGYFPAIDHEVLLELLYRRFKGEGFLALLQRIVHSYHAVPGKGLPIGSLTSQHFANHYLAGADEWLRDHDQVQAQVRYMDDILFWCASQAEARQLRNEFQDYLQTERRLTVKPTVQINRSARGVTYCGYRMVPGAIRLTPRKKRRYRQLRERLERAWHEGDISSLQLQQGYASVHAITLHTNSRAWRKIHLQRCPARDYHDGG